MASKKQANKVAKVMREYKKGTLHSGKGGPVVKSKKQAVAIAMSQAKMSKSKDSDKKHERKESAAERRREYGSAKKTPKGYHRMPDGKLMKGSRHKG
jgi:hypothetical protein